ncbi:hypothetical protein QR680_012774 [Steinernema hermaphroditum]|uniref:RNA-directed DNA polymerase n=1 Tax=Steinernema hermaphroditum TaxID=289476 RepID=A0AA39I344_9BILA|nr:hypothetical protein QR680_012774 [Steinernema hermaphroditum]
MGNPVSDTDENGLRLGQETEELHHDRVSLALGKVMHQARQANEWTQKVIWLQGSTRSRRLSRNTRMKQITFEIGSRMKVGRLEAAEDGRQKKKKKKISYFCSELYGGMEPGEYDSILESLGGANPIIFGATKNEKDSYRRKLKSFCAENGKLFYMVKDSRREVVRKGEVNSVIHKAHHVALNHQGRNAVIEFISQRYYWSGIKADVSKFIQRCHQCQLNRVNLKMSTELRPIRPPHEPFSTKHGSLHYVGYLCPSSTD